jgi:iron transport multicopper oxidase
LKLTLPSLFPTRLTLSIYSLVSWNLYESHYTLTVLLGQRYSAVLEANQSPNNYWIRARPSSGKNNLTSTFEGGVNSAILRYKGASNAEPTTTQQTSQNLLVEADLHPLFNPTAPGTPTPDGADTTLNLNLTFDTSTFRFSINGTSFVPPSVPVLLQILSGAQNAHDLLPEGSVYTVERGKTVQINLPSGLIGGPHPFHLHGVSYVHLS